MDDQSQLALADGADGAANPLSSFQRPPQDVTAAQALDASPVGRMEMDSGAGLDYDREGQDDAWEPELVLDDDVGICAVCDEDSQAESGIVSNRYACELQFGSNCQGDLKLESLIWSSREL